MIGSEAARQLGVAPGDPVTLQYGGRQAALTVAGVITSGAAEDNQLFVSLDLAFRSSRESPGRLACCN